MDRNEKREREPQGSFIGIAALAVGVLFVVLAGVIFVSTAWWTMPDMVKVLMILAFAAVFFGVSMAAEHLLQIHKTANACYVSGCIFLFLTVLAAGGFGLLKPLFLNGDYGLYWWRVLSAGGVVMAAAMFLGIRWFGGRFYTAACYWSVTANIILVLKAFGLSGTGVVQGMAFYACLLMLLVLTGRGLTNHRTFAGLHFMIFAGLLIVQCQSYGVSILFGRSFADPVHVDGVAGNLCSLAAVAFVSGLLAWKEERDLFKCAFQILVLEWIHLGVSGIPALMGFEPEMDQVLTVMAVLTALFFVAGRRLLPGLRCGVGDLIETVAVFYDILPVAFLAVLSSLFGICDSFEWRFQAEFLILVVLLAYMVKEWGKTFHLIRIILPFVLWGTVSPAATLLNELVLAADWWKWLTIVYVALLMGWDFVKHDVFGPGIAVISGFMILVAAIKGEPETETLWFLLLGIYILRYANNPNLRKPVWTASMMLLTAAYFRQPWISWPEIVELEMFLLPVAGNIYGLGRIWKGSGEIGILQTMGFTICLLMLGADAVRSGQLADALILEGICLAVFLLAHVAGNRRWIRISGGFLAAVAFYMTKDFWISLAWWVYLMAAGIGLIIFGAIREKNKRSE